MFIYSAIVLITIIGFYSARTIRIETDLTGYSLASAEALDRYNELQADFAQPGPGESVVILEHTEGWNSFEAFRSLDRLADFWEEQAEVESVSGITKVIYPRQAVLTVRRQPFFNLKNEAAFNKRYADWSEYADITRKFVSADQRYALLFLATKTGEGLSQKSIEDFGKVLGNQAEVKAYFLQNDLIEKEVQRLTRQDAIQLAIISTVLILAAFYLLTKSLRGLLLITLMVAFNLACTLMFMQVMDMPFTIHMITVPCIVIVLSFTDIMHILYHHRICVDRGLQSAVIRQQVIHSVQRPMFVTSLTNVIGFLIFLLLSENVYLFNFSLVSITGVVIAFLSSRFLILNAINPEKPLIRRSDFEKLTRIHSRLARSVQVNRKVVYGLLLSLSILVIVLVTARFEIDSSEGEMMSEASALTRASDILNEEFFGDKQAEVIIKVNSGELWSAEILMTIDSLEREIEDIFSPAYLESPSLLVRRFRRYQRNGHPMAFTLPQKVGPTLRHDLNAYAESFGGGSILSEDRKTAKIAFGFRNKGLEASREQYALLEKTLSGYKASGLDFELTGRSFLGDVGAYDFTIKIIIGLLVGIVAASILTMVFIRSARKSLGLIFVNLFPVVTVLALMLLAGITITPLTLFFLSLLAGICVDDSIYIVMQKGKSKLHIFPIVVTSTVLGVGFIALGFSSFLWVRPFSWVFLLGLLLALVMDLLILPSFMKTESK
ncbi:MAG: hypothetical protein Roseis2KO_60170 [Roseivirga sp.]